MRRRLDNLIRNAVEIARGVELRSLIDIPWLIYGDRKFHDQITAESLCIERRHKNVDIDALYEIVKIPRGAWAKRRHNEGWFFWKFER